MSTSIPVVDANGIPIPTWLETHANTIPPPPVATNFQLLPFQNLTWENFERLCLRYIRLQGSVEFCQAYGLKGQDQEGIDFYARLNQPVRFAVYQCKRIEELERRCRSLSGSVNGPETDPYTYTILLTSNESRTRAARSNERKCGGLSRKAV